MADGGVRHFGAECPVLAALVGVPDVGAAVHAGGARRPPLEDSQHLGGAPQSALVGLFVVVRRKGPSVELRRCIGAFYLVVCVEVEGREVGEGRKGKMLGEELLAGVGGELFDGGGAEVGGREGEQGQQGRWEEEDGVK